MTALIPAPVAAHVPELIPCGAQGLTGVSPAHQFSHARVRSKALLGYLAQVLLCFFTVAQDPHTIFAMRLAASI